MAKRSKSKIQPSAKATPQSLSIGDKSSSPNRIATEQCPTLSGRSTLTYHIAINGDDQVALRIFSNTGGGYFSSEYVLLNNVLTIISKHDEKKPLSSMDLVPLFSGKSVNTPGYLLAVLVNEQIVVPSKLKQRQWCFGDVEDFMAKVALLTPEK